MVKRDQKTGNHGFNVISAVTNILDSNQMAHGKLNLPTESHIEDNPHEAGKGIIIGAYANRKSEEWKRLREKKRNQGQRHNHPDIEIDEVIRKHGDENIKIVYDSSSC